MNYKEKLISLYKNSYSVSDVKLTKECINNISVIADNCLNAKGVYTVLITLAIYKIIHNEQDIRYHQAKMENGFNARGIDTKYITPTLAELKLPHMGECGVQTKSLAIEKPYDFEYVGAISKGKDKFLWLVDFIQHNPNQCEDVVRVLLNKVKAIQESNQVEITKIENIEKIDILVIIDILEKHFNAKYSGNHGASKLPVLAFYAIFKCLIKELKRYENCKLLPLGSHTGSDKTSKSAGDIEIVDKDNKLIEALEIKLGKSINTHMIQVAREKIIEFNPIRYCIFSSEVINDNDMKEIAKEIEKIKLEHGCQLIVNGLIPTLKYYLRLIISLSDFINEYSTLIENDDELKPIHKATWNELLADIK